jgi:ribonuclease PH
VVASAVEEEMLLDPEDEDTRCFETSATVFGCPVRNLVAILTTQQNKSYVLNRLVKGNRTFKCIVIRWADRTNFLP